MQPTKPREARACQRGGLISRMRAEPRIAVKPVKRQVRGRAEAEAGAGAGAEAETEAEAGAQTGAEAETETESAIVKKAVYVS